MKMIMIWVMNTMMITNLMTAWIYVKRKVKLAKKITYLITVMNLKLTITRSKSIKENLKNIVTKNTTQKKVKKKENSQKAMTGTVKKKKTEKNKEEDRKDLKMKEVTQVMIKWMI